MRLPAFAEPVFLVWIALIPSPVCAEQIVINHAPVKVTKDNLDPILIPADATLSSANASAVMSALKGAVKASDASAQLEAESYVLHVVRLDALKKPKISNWYIYRSNVSFYPTFHTNQTRFETLRLYGESTFGVAYLFLFDSPIAAGSSVTLPSVEYDISVTKATSQLVSDLQGLAQIITAPSKGGALIAPDVVGFGYAQVIKINPGPSSVDFSAQTGATADAVKEFSKTTVKNESRYPIGFSVAVPLQSYQEISYQPNGGGSTFAPQTVQRQNVYLTLDVYIPSADLSDPSDHWIPYLIVGVPIKSQPWNQVMVGLAMGFKYVDPFVAVVFDRINSPTTSDAIAVTTTTKRMVIWGLNIPVSAAVKALGVGK